VADKPPSAAHRLREADPLVPEGFVAVREEFLEPSQTSSTHVPPTWAAPR